MVLTLLVPGVVIGQGWTGGNNVDVLGVGWSTVQNQVVSYPGVNADARRCHLVQPANTEPLPTPDLGMCDELGGWEQGATASQPFHENHDQVLRSAAWLNPDLAPRMMVRCVVDIQNAPFSGHSAAEAHPVLGLGATTVCFQQFAMQEDVDLRANVVAASDEPVPSSWYEDTADLVHEARALLATRVYDDDTHIREDKHSWQVYYIKNGFFCCRSTAVGNLTDAASEDSYRLIDSNATRWEILDPSGDDVLRSGGEIVPIIDLVPTIVSGVEVTRAPDPEVGAGAKSWLFQPVDGSPMSIEFKADGTNGWTGEIRRYVEAS